MITNFFYSLLKKKFQKKRRGFTLVEILIVVVFFGILVTMVAAYLNSSRQVAKDSKIAMGIAQVDSVAEMIHLRHGEYDALCQSSFSLSSERGLNTIQEETEKLGGEISCFAEGNSYCVAAKLGSGKFFCLRNDRRADFSEFGCSSPTVGCDSEGSNGNGNGNGGEIGDICPKMEGEVVLISLGYQFVLALKSDGTVWSWGRNDFGQLGDNTTINRPIPVQVTGLGGAGFLTNITTISAGTHHSLALNESGEVFSWGRNFFGSLGDGTAVRRHAPIKVVGPGRRGNLTDIISVAAGEEHSLALKSDGTVWAWGDNRDGQLGSGSFAIRIWPVQVIGPFPSNRLTGITKISTRFNFSLAIDNNGNVFAWGDNASGQLGDGSQGSRNNRPVQVKGIGGAGFLGDIKSVSAGDAHSLALNEIGEVYAWGNNSYGQLGDNSTTNSLFPIKVKGVGGIGFLAGIKEVSAGRFRSFAIDGSNSLLAWGFNHNSLLGDGTTEDSHFPIGIENPTNVVNIFNNAVNSLVLKSDGTVWIWGQNSYGQFGEGTIINSNIPIRSCDLIPCNGGPLEEGLAVKIFVGEMHSLSVREDGAVFTWGYNENGQLGDDTTENKNVPTRVIGGDTGAEFFENATSVSGGNGFSLALKENGTVWAWGINNYGQLGDYFTTTRYSPVQVMKIDGVLTNIKDISSGSDHSLALDNSQNVWSWGRNARGQLGHKDTNDKFFAYKVSNVAGNEDLGNIKAISTGFGHSLALDNNGNVFAWGLNNYGQLGDGTGGTDGDYKDTPIQVKGVNGVGNLTNIISIGGGFRSSYALDNSGNLYAWGENTYGQLGDGSTIDRLTPIKVRGVGGLGDLESIVAIGKSHYHNFFAVDSEGSVYSWGRNTNGSLGDGTGEDRYYPVQVKGDYGIGFLSDVSFISGGGSFTLAFKNDKTIWAWGSNSFGQLGDGTTISRSFPIKTKDLE